LAPIHDDEDRKLKYYASAAMLVIFVSMWLDVILSNRGVGVRPVLPCQIGWLTGEVLCPHAIAI
jgi:hypothetical protein